MKRIVLIVGALIAAAGQAGGLENGGIWRDTGGVHINAHGGGLLREGDVWYWYGEHKVEGKAGNRAQVGVGCYSSKDLLVWNNEGVALKVSETPGNDIEKDCILERPKVVKAPATGKYVMLFHLERKGNGYGDARVGFAVSDSPTGPFKFKYSCRPLDAMSRDMTVFTDDEGSVWHIFASESNSTLHFAELNGDCLGYSGKCHRVAEKHWTEAPAIIKRGGWYWLLGSGCTGWKPNAARIYRAKSLEGPWEWLGNPCTGVNPANMLGADKTWGGQSTCIFHDPTSGLDVACFDIWQPSNAIDGRYVWLPILWKGDAMPEIPWRGTWDTQKPEDRSLVGGPNSEWGVFQWGVEVDGFVHNETKSKARAYLWIPPVTKCVKAVVIGNDNMLEEPLFSNPDFRRTLAAADVAIVFVTPGLQGFNEKFDEGDVPALDALLAKLATASGHRELAKEVRIVPLGHSAWADWPYLCTAAMLERIRCAVSLKGSWPHFRQHLDDAFWKKTEGVPMLLVGGEYEWFSERMGKERGFLKSHPNVKLYPVADWESGHFDMTDALPLAIAEFIVKGSVPKIPRSGGKFCVLGFKDR
ncbi:MAG: family 43 glycosylhydrolase, partial [Kiritimatiellae bacterium]|nr:family 43 glycosylhydrolase [Kiritimatiellia bacterium]